MLRVVGVGQGRIDVGQGGVIRQVIESTFTELGRLLPPEDFEVMLGMVQRLDQPET